MRVALKSATRFLVAHPVSDLSVRGFSLSQSHKLTPTVVLPLHSHRPAKTLVRIATPSFRSCGCAPMSTVQVRDRIDLSDTERSIFDRLLATLRHFHLQTQLRVAGGWVRDKVTHLLFFSPNSFLVILFVLF